MTTNNSLKSDESYTKIVSKLIQTLVTKLVQILEQNPDALFQSVEFTKQIENHDVVLESNRSSTSNNKQGNWVKRVLKIQKVMKIMEKNFATKSNVSKVSDPLCRSLK
jgi:hypothetical protein